MCIFVFCKYTHLIYFPNIVFIIKKYRYRPMFCCSCSILVIFYIKKFDVWRCVFCFWFFTKKTITIPFCKTCIGLNLMFINIVIYVLRIERNFETISVFYYIFYLFHSEIIQLHCGNPKAQIVAGSQLQVVLLVTFCNILLLHKTT